MEWVGLFLTAAGAVFMVGVFYLIAVVICQILKVTERRAMDVYDHQRCGMKNQCRDKARLVQELRAEVERLHNAESERDEARAECARLRADAERYRWLRDKANSDDLAYYCHIDRRAWDGDIDAAREGE